MNIIDPVDVALDAYEDGLEEELSPDARDVFVAAYLLGERAAGGTPANATHCKECDALLVFGHNRWWHADTSHQTGTNRPAGKPTSLIRRGL